MHCTILIGGTEALSLLDGNPAPWRDGDTGFLFIAHSDMVISRDDGRRSREGGRDEFERVGICGSEGGVFAEDSTAEGFPNVAVLCCLFLTTKDQSS